VSGCPLTPVVPSPSAAGSHGVAGEGAAPDGGDHLDAAAALLDYHSEHGHWLNQAGGALRWRLLRSP
jgi:hypothetical protein